MTEIGIVKGSVKETSLKEITSTIKKFKLEKASGFSEVSMKIINTNGKVGIDDMKRRLEEIA